MQITFADIAKYFALIQKGVNFVLFAFIIVDYLFYFFLLLVTFRILQRAALNNWIIIFGDLAFHT